MKKMHVVLIALIATSLSLPACGGEGTEPVVSSEPLTIRFGNLPYLDYGPWIVAEKMGYLEEQGIQLETTMFEVEQPEIEAMLGNSIDAGAGADSPLILLAPQAKDTVLMVSVHSLFTGYSIMGRPGEVKTYDEFVAEGKTNQEALAAACEQLRGKTIILPGGASFYPVLDTCLGYAGLTKEDLEIIDMDPVEGAAAFLQGTGDFYSDGLPQRFRLEQEGMVNVVTGVQMGGGAMDTAGLYVTRTFYDENRAAVYGLLKAWYKAVDYIKSDPDAAIPIMVDWINEQSGAGMTKEDARRFLEDLVLFPTYDEVNDWFFSEGSAYYWPNRLEFVKSYNENADPPIDFTGIDLNAMFPVNEVYPQVKP
jgi:ABC-type nitrate/sulfonate/bicarbonate transport system substrate-binding protein